MIEFHRYRISGCTNTIENMDAKIFVSRCVPFPCFPRPDNGIGRNYVTCYVEYLRAPTYNNTRFDSTRYDTLFHAFFPFFFFLYFKTLFFQKNLMIHVATVLSTSRYDVT